MLFWKICFPFVSLPYPVFWNRFLLWKVQQIFNFHLSSLKMPREIKEIKASFWNILSRLNSTNYLLNFVRFKAIFMSFCSSKGNFEWKFDFFFQDFLLKARRKDAKSVKIKKNADNTKFKVRISSNYLSFLSFVTIFMLLKSSMLTYLFIWWKPTRRQFRVLLRSVNVRKERIMIS